jgi:hypothetical protein
MSLLITNDTVLTNVHEQCCKKLHTPSARAPQIELFKVLVQKNNKNNKKKHDGQTCPFIHEMNVKVLNDFKKITHTYF